jgi:hypothetical protein
VRPRLYLDEDVYHSVALGLRRRGWDAATTVDAGKVGSSDEDQIRFATAEGRCLFTFNRGHFAEIHGHMMAVGEHHCGIIVCRQATVGVVTRSLCALLSSHIAEDLHDSLVWLSPRT